MKVILNHSSTDLRRRAARCCRFARGHAGSRPGRLSTCRTLVVWTLETRLADGYQRIHSLEAESGSFTPKARPAPPIRVPIQQQEETTNQQSDPPTEMVVCFQSGWTKRSGYACLRNMDWTLSVFQPTRG
jgi:hypothetical protein